MRALICGALAAMTLGGMGGAGMRLAPDEFSTRPNGPQLVMTPPRTYSLWEHDPAPVDASYPGGVMPDRRRVQARLHRCARESLGFGSGAWSPAR